MNKCTVKYNFEPGSEGRRWYTLEAGFVYLCL